MEFSQKVEIFVTHPYGWGAGGGYFPLCQCGSLGLVREVVGSVGG